MVRDGIYYALAFFLAGLAVTFLAGPWLALPLYLVGLFCAYFFRDPERPIPVGAVAISPADGKVVAVLPQPDGHHQISIFLNIFDVHVNRAPISGTVVDVTYSKGLFLVASRGEASAQNEQNSITIQGDGTRVVFRQIAGLIARRIVCTTKPGDYVSAGQRIGLIKFGSRVDVIVGPEWIVAVSPGVRVSAGSSILARRKGVPEPVDAMALKVEDGVLCPT